MTVIRSFRVATLAGRLHEVVRVAGGLCHKPQGAALHLSPDHYRLIQALYTSFRVGTPLANKWLQRCWALNLSAPATGEVAAVWIDPEGRDDAAGNWPGARHRTFWMAQESQADVEAWFPPPTPQLEGVEQAQP